MSRTANLVVMVMAAALVGCAASPKPLYHWGEYQRQVYEYLKGDGTTPSEQLTVMLAQAEKAQATNTALPPGFRAHLAMLHLRLGHDDEALRLIETEKSVFPESAVYMNFVLKSMSKKKS